MFGAALPLVETQGNAAACFLNCAFTTKETKNWTWLSEVSSVQRMVMSYKFFQRSKASPYFYQNEKKPVFPRMVGEKALLDSSLTILVSPEVTRYPLFALQGSGQGDGRTRA